MTSPLRYLRQVVAPNGRHRARPLHDDELLGPEPTAPAGVFVQAWDDCPDCRKATAGVLHKDGWTCGECLGQVAGGAA